MGHDKIIILIFVGASTHLLLRLAPSNLHLKSYTAVKMLMIPLDKNEDQFCWICLTSVVEDDNDQNYYNYLQKVRDALTNATNLWIMVLRILLKSFIG